MRYTVARTLLPFGSLLPLRGGPEGDEGGLKLHSEGFLCHIKGQDFFVHLCGGREAPEMLGKRPHTPKPFCQAGALTRCIFKTDIPEL